MQLQVLSRSEVRAVHEASIEVLEHVGVRILEPRALEMLNEFGCTVDRETSIAHIPESLVMESVKKAPRSFTLYGRKKKMILEEGRTYFSTQGTAIFVFDPFTGERRSSTLKDVENFYRLADALENVHHATLVVYPTDVPEHKAHAYALLAALKNTTKTIDVYARSRSDALDCVKIASIAAGGLDELRKKPMILFFYNPISPLQHSRELLEGLMVFAENSQPVIIAPECQAGATAPATLAGLLVQQNAEVLSAIVVAELVNPGTPVLYGTVSTIMDMRTGNIALGSVETGLINAATAQIARYYGLPCRGTGGVTEAKAPDFQAGFEKAVTLLMASLSGVNFIYDAAGSLDSTLSASYEQVVMDDELCGIAARAAKGVEVSSESLALEVIEDVGPGGHYLNKIHTVKHVREEHYIPKLFTRLRWEAWLSAKGMLEQAREKVERILKEHEPEPLDPSVERELTLYVEKFLND
ncbi:MAG: trimethylamine methyltransferase family protein [Thermofilaceae archaeon]|nr:trimethylamine methyltransferase family protein [Thermofilaceae archaeon]MCX8181273.1 trimethylamine methyltransferase family protein [Thermofilaceae archaeon]MDW8003508.1 trimethylamine methyltransferase family protein [Thermofilaceae archaeon]